MAGSCCQFILTIPSGRRKQRKSWSAPVPKMFPPREKLSPKRVIRHAFAKLPDRLSLKECTGARWAGRVPQAAFDIGHPAAEHFSKTLFACPGAAYGAR